MEGSCRGVLAMLVILAGLTVTGSGYQIIEGPKNVTVLKGSEAHFNCTVSTGWELIMWALKGTVVLSLTPQKPIITSSRFTSASYSVDGNDISEMIIHDVQPSDAGLVECSVQNSNVHGSAFLSVEVMGTLNIPGDSLVVIEGEPCNVTCYVQDWTPLPDISWEIGVPVSHSSYFSFGEPDNLQLAGSVLALTPLGNGSLTCVAILKNTQADKSLTVNLTVVQPTDSVDHSGTSLPTWAIILLAVSFSLLLILIIVLVIIFCCCCVSGREKKESSYQSEIRKSANMKTNKGAPKTKLKTGNENYGYSSEEARAAQVDSLSPKYAEVSILEQRGSSLPYQEPQKHQPGPESRPQVSFHLSSPQKVRNVTLV